MSKLFNTVKVELKLFFRNKIIWIVLPLILLYSTYGFYIFNISEKNSGQAIMSSSFVVQAGLFGFMVLGYYLIRTERDNQCDEVFFSLPYGEVYKIIGKFIVNLLLVTGFVLFNNIVLFILYSLAKVPKEMYLDSLLYFIFYWEVGFVIVVTIGMIIGTFIKSRAAYVTMFILWLFIGPLNYYVFRPLATLLRLDLRVPQYILNLGQHDPHAAYNVLYGFPLQSFNLTQRLLLLFLVLTLFFILYWRKEKKIIIISLAVFLIVFIPTFNNYKRNFGMIKSYGSYTHPEQYDIYYYLEHKDDKIPKSETGYQVKACDIDLKIDNEVKMNARLKIKLDNSGDKLLFTLYRDFNINSIRDETGKTLRFNRNGDSIEVIFNSKLNKGEEKIIDFSYKGFSSPLFFADENAVMLPAYFPYIPSSVNASVMSYTDTGFYRNDCSYTADYTLTYRGKHNLYTNLNKVGENKWEGKNVRGVTLVSGNIKEGEYEGISYYYPTISSNSDNVSDFRNYLKVYKDGVNTINKKFNENINDDIKKIFFIPIPSETNIATSLYKADDTLIVQNVNSSTRGYSGEENGVLESVLELALRSSIRNNNSSGTRNFFIEANGLVSSDEEGSGFRGFSFMSEIYRKEAEDNKKNPGSYNHDSEIKAEVYEKILAIYKEDKNKLDKLLVKLYGKIKNEDMTFEKVNEFIDKGEWMHE
jgi:hypothetical protein